MRARILIRILQFPAALAIVAAITVVYHKAIPVNATTVALTFLLAILAVSTFWGMAVAVVMSAVSMVAWNYYFLPPTGTLTISDPENWVALFAFLAVAIISSKLSTQARQQAADALARRRDMEKLYAFSQGLLESRNVMELVNKIPSQIVNAFEVGAAALFLADKQKVYRSGPVVPQLDTESLKSILARDEPVGSLGISGSVLPRQTLEAIATLIAVAMEHARAVEQVGQTEAAREAEKLRTALLDAVTHALRTPLTSIKASVTNLISNPNLASAQRTELLTIINEESDRLNRLVGEAGEMARLDAGDVELNVELHPIDHVITAALERCRPSLGN